MGAGRATGDVMEGVNGMRRLIGQVRPFSMVPTDSLEALGAVVRTVLEERIPGDLVECGVWRGGASFLMAGLLKAHGVSDRRVWMFDSFEGLPAPEEIDGARAMEYARRTESPAYADNCRASLEEVRANAESLGLTDLVTMVPGWFDATLPAHRDAVGRIAVLRIDADWYASVRCCLEELYDGVVTGGFLLLDDFFTWEGCHRACREYFSRRTERHSMKAVVRREAGEGRLLSAIVRKDAEW